MARPANPFSDEQKRQIQGRVEQARAAGLSNEQIESRLREDKRFMSHYGATQRQERNERARTALASKNLANQQIISDRSRQTAIRPTEPFMAESGVPSVASVQPTRRQTPQNMLTPMGGKRREVASPDMGSSFARGQFSPSQQTGISTTQTALGMEAPEQPTLPQAEMPTMPSMDVDTTQVADIPTTQPTSEEAMLQREIESDQQKYLQDIARAGTLYDRGIEDLEIQRLRREEQLNKQLEETMMGLDNQIQDVERNMLRNLGTSRKIGALQGTGRSSGYIQGIQNIADDWRRVIGRLNQMKQMADQATDDAKAILLEDYNRALKQSKEDFEYQFRDLMNNANVVAQDLVNQYGLSSDKLNNKLTDLSLETQMKYESLVGQRINNMNKANQTMFDMTDQLFEMNTRQREESERFGTMLMQDDATIMSLTQQDLQGLMDQWRITPDQAYTFAQTIMGRGQNTLMELSNGLATQQDMADMQDMLAKGFDVQTAIAAITQANPDRYSPLQARTFADQMKLEEFGLSQRRQALSEAQFQQEVFMDQQEAQAKWVSQPVFTADMWATQTPTSFGSGSNVGVDFDVNVWDVITSPVNGKLEDIWRNEKTGNIYAILRDTDGAKVIISHLDPSTVERFSSMIGKDISVGTPIGIGGNSGNVKDIEGNWLRKDGEVQWERAQDKLNQWFGSHTDNVVELADGTRLRWQEALDYLWKWYKEFELITNSITNFMTNASAEKQNARKAELQSYLQSGNKNAVKTAYQANFLDDLEWSQKADHEARLLMMEGLKGIQRLMDEYTAAWWDLGIFVGTRERVANKVGRTTDERLKTLQIAMLDQLDMLARDRTGAALTESEERFYDRLMPSINKNSEFNTAVINGMLNTLENTTVDGMRNIMKQKLPQEVFDYLFEDGEDMELALAPMTTADYIQQLSLDF